MEWNCRGLTFHFYQDLNYKLLTIYSIHQGNEILPLELRATKQKSLIVSLYKAPSIEDKMFISEINKALTFYTNFYMLLMGDFNMMPENQQLQDFFGSYHLKYSVNEPTCFKKTPFTVDLLVTNIRNLLHFSTYETRMPDYHQRVYIKYVGWREGGGGERGGVQCTTGLYFCRELLNGK